MKTIKQRKLVVAICLACGVNSAQAAISDGAPAPGSGQAGELYLNIWDQTATSSYALDLGTLVTDMVSSQNSNRVWNLDQTFKTWSAQTTDTLTFNVAGNNSYIGRNTVLDSVIMSSLTGFTNTMNPNMNGLITMQKNVSSHAININGAAGDLTNYAANNSVVSTSGNAYFGDPAWGAGLGIPGYVGSATVRNGGTDQTLDLYNIHSPGGTTTAGTPAIVDTLNGYLTLNVAAATLTWNAVTPVPLPGAVWLFLGGLLTTLNLQKRKARLTAA